MTYTVHIKVTLPPNYEVKTGVYLDESITLPSRTWEVTLRELRSLIKDMKEVAE